MNAGANGDGPTGPLGDTGGGGFFALTGGSAGSGGGTGGYGGGANSDGGGGGYSGGGGGGGSAFAGAGGGGGSYILSSAIDPSISILTTAGDGFAEIMTPEPSSLTLLCAAALAGGLLGLLRRRTQA